MTLYQLSPDKYPPIDTVIKIRVLPADKCPADSSGQYRKPFTINGITLNFPLVI
jgi:hypothetical protein